jgi:hypothetical protein
MSEESKPQYAIIERECGGDISAFCPICGKPTAKSSDEDPDYTPCEHLAFLYLGLISDFEYRSDDFKKRTEALDRKDLNFDNFQKYLEDAGYDNRLLALEISQSGIACGPIGFSEIYGFDYGC